MSQAKLIVATVTALQLLMATAVAAVQVALPGCPQACGNVTVPYPFGFRRGCFRKGFNLTCDETRRPPRLLLGDGVEVDAISLADGTVHVQTKVVAFRPLYTNGAVGARRSIDHNYSWYGGLPEVYKSGGAQLAVSTDHNVFVAIGCNFIGYLVAVSDGGREYVSTCSTLCNGKTRDALCTGVGCCWTTIAQRYPGYQVKFKDLDDTAAAYAGQSRASVAAFIVDREWFVGTMQNTVSFNDFVNDDFGNGPSSMPTVLQWWLDVDSDRDLVVKDPRSASRWRCISLNSFAAYIGDAVNKVRCNCSDGYEGNSYIVDGCQDIGECLRPDVYPCHGTCINMPGTYRCSAKKRIISLAGLITIIAIVAGFGLLFSLLGVAQVTKKLKKGRAKKIRQKFFKKNHGLLLQQLISSNKDIAEKMKIFSLEELEQATNKFDHNRILGGGGHGTVYKAILSDQRVVAIKKAKIVVQREIDQFINEVAILSQINHRNVVKLFGCCLETEVPLLVYEFILNGTLSCHLHGKSENHLSWKTRLRIALETARAIASLHSAASISVYHRDIKCANILLTDTLIAKVSDFGASRSIAIDGIGILTVVQGTYGYLDPEYYYTSRLTKKSDVYSFGVILAELLTSVTPVFSSHSSEGTSLASHFVSLMSGNRLSDILDTQIIHEGGVEDAEVVARLAQACLSLKGEERPTMRQVETTLEDVHNSKVKLSSQITRVNQSAMKDQPWMGNKGGEGTRLYSLEKEIIQSSEIPR
ncbi:wall-associated receptor kinase-like 8 [Triticum dicoccoides]|uniref:wall-associated receptor kinase-like 8 n=1 Tax=Triticum dicoccoides TaxID=85692 RepID=UPI0018903554|nr:wall-associated receptor kinase-like 8 [Triticum dicoccoides]